MNNQSNSQNSVLTTAIIVMGFVVMTALVVRQDGSSVEITPVQNLPIPKVTVKSAR